MNRAAACELKLQTHRATRHARLHVEHDRRRLLQAPAAPVEARLHDVRVPRGSEITLRTEAPSAPRLILKGRHRTSAKFAATPDGAWEAKAILEVMKEHNPDVTLGLTAFGLGTGAPRHSRVRPHSAPAPLECAHTGL